MFGTVATGKLQDKVIKSTQRSVELKKLADKEARGEVEGEQEIELTGCLDPNDLLDFPLEQARLSLLPICESSRLGRRRLI